MTTEYVCKDCGCDLTQDGFIQCICPSCGGTDSLPWELYDDIDGRQPAPSEHAPRKYTLAGDGEYMVSERGNPQAWICANVSESEAGICEVRE